MKKFLLIFLLILLIPQSQQKARTMQNSELMAYIISPTNGTVVNSFVVEINVNVTTDCIVKIYADQIPRGEYALERGIHKLRVRLPERWGVHLIYIYATKENTTTRSYTMVFANAIPIYVGFPASILIAIWVYLIIKSKRRRASYF